MDEGTDAINVELFEEDEEVPGLTGYPRHQNSTNSSRSISPEPEVSLRANLANLRIDFADFPVHLLLFAGVFNAWGPGVMSAVS